MSMMTMDRTMMGGSMMPGMMPQMPAPMMQSMPQMMGMGAGMMIPRCMMRMEKIENGMCMYCTTEDAMAAGMIQSLCAMMPGAMCSCICLMNGMPCCTCNLMMAACMCENIEGGVKITCTSGDAMACKMIQACCDCCAEMMMAGCMCCVTLGGMPVCCGTMMSDKMG